MSDDHKAVIYPACYFNASPTWFRWNKLTVADVLLLRHEPGFEGQHIWFWLNHPIQWVRLVGMIVQIDMVANGKYVLLTLDDSSGANIEVRIERKESGRSQHGKEYTTHTTLDNVRVTINMNLPTVLLEQKPLDIGSIIMAEGTIGKYWTGRQLILKRLRDVKDTNEEAMHWSKVAQWKREVLSKSWVLSEVMRAEIDAEIAKEERTRLKRVKHDKRRRAEHEEKRIAHKERAEQKRKTWEAHLNEGALPGSDYVPRPWDP